MFDPRSPCELALAFIHKQFNKVKRFPNSIQDNKTEKQHIVMEARLGAIFKKEADYAVLKKMKGKDLQGKGYTPLLPYFKHMKETGAFR